MQGSRIRGLGGGIELPELRASLRKVAEIEVPATIYVADESGSSAYGIKRW